MALKQSILLLVYRSILLYQRSHSRIYDTGNPIVAPQAPIELACVVATVKQLEAENLTTTHMISLGGWNAPHPTTANPITGKTYTAQEMYDAFNTWNIELAKQYGWNGFDGIDWDMEGANEVSSPINEFTVDCLNLVGQLSQLAKADGYIVSLVPPESYFDPTTGNFSRSLLFDYPEWAPLVSFYYHGRNAYAYMFSRYGESTLNGLTVPTFDFVTFQLYETYSHADYNITVAGMPGSEYLVNIVNRFIDGWMVEFAMDPSVDYPSKVTCVFCA